MIGLTAESLYPFLLATMRALGLLLIMPLFSGAPVPATIRMALAVMLGLLCADVAAAGAGGSLPPHWFSIVLMSAHEFLAGLAMGFAARFLWWSLEFAGQSISTEIGIILSSGMDPITHSNSSPGAAVLSWLGNMIFLASGAYRLCLAAFVQSFEVFPPGAAFSAGSAEWLIGQSGAMISLAIQIATPVLAVNFFVNFVFALLARVAPSLEAYSASVPARLIAGLTMFSLSLGLAAQLIGEHLADVEQTMLRALR